MQEVDELECNMCSFMHKTCFSSYFREVAEKACAADSLKNAEVKFVKLKILSISPKTQMYMFYFLLVEIK